MPLRIDRVEVFGVAMPLVDAFTSGGVTKSTTNGVVVRVHASDGAIGISSIDPATTASSPHTAPELAVAVRERIAPALLGEDPTNVHRILELAQALTPLQPGAGAAVEQACIELTCRRLGIALYDYLGGGVEDRLLFNGWIGELPPEEAAAEARRWLDAGFKSAKIKVGSGVERDRDRVAAVRDVVGSAMELRIDANQQYDAATAPRALRGGQGRRPAAVRAADAEGRSGGLGARAARGRHPGDGGRVNQRSREPRAWSSRPTAPTS